jgi:hypothetical protein
VLPTRDRDGLLHLEPENGHTLPLRGSQVALEWVEPYGLARASATIVETYLTPPASFWAKLETAPVLVERRENLRATIEIPVLALPPGAPQPLRGRTVNLAATGALLRLADLPEATTEFELVFKLDQPLRTTAMVLRREPGLVGVAFRIVDPSDHDTLDRLVLDSLRRNGP